MAKIKNWKIRGQSSFCCKKVLDVKSWKRKLHLSNVNAYIYFTEHYVSAKCFHVKRQCELFRWVFKPNN